MIKIFDKTDKIFISNGNIVINVPDGIYVTSEIGFKEDVCAVFGDTDNGIKYGYINIMLNLILLSL